MTKARSTRSILFQAANEARHPAYLVNRESKIVFANQALCGWLQVSLDKIENQECTRSAGKLANPRELLHGLAPPREAFAHETTEGKVFRTAADGHLIWRTATFVTLNGSIDLPGEMFVFVGSADLPGLDFPETTSASQADLHNLLLEIKSRLPEPDFECSFGVSQFSQLLRDRIKLAKNTNVNLLIQGRKGSGKEELAKALYLAKKINEPLTPIDCRVADAELIQTAVRAVRVVRKNAPRNQKSWILLSDIDQLSSQAAYELEGFLELPGFSIRFISTCTDSNAIAKPLLSRLSVLQLDIEPLRNRKQDIPVLAEQILLHAQRDTTFDRSAIQMLTEYDWPGEFTEMKNRIQTVINSVTSHSLSPADFPDEFHHRIQAQQIGGPSETKIDLEKYLEEIEKQLISRALDQVKNNKTKASELLGISRAKLGRKVQQFQLEPEQPVIFKEAEDE